jgi:hypothetical protein
MAEGGEICRIPFWSFLIAFITRSPGFGRELTKLKVAITIKPVMKDQW